MEKMNSKVQAHELSPPTPERKLGRPPSWRRRKLADQREDEVARLFELEEGRMAALATSREFNDKRAAELASLGILPPVPPLITPLVLPEPRGIEFNVEKLDSENLAEIPRKLDTSLKTPICLITLDDDEDAAVEPPKKRPRFEQRLSRTETITGSDSNPLTRSDSAAITRSDSTSLTRSNSNVAPPQLNITNSNGTLPIKTLLRKEFTGAEKAVLFQIDPEAVPKPPKPAWADLQRKSIFYAHSPCFGFPADHILFTCLSFKNGIDLAQVATMSEKEKESTFDLDAGSSVLLEKILQDAQVPRSKKVGSFSFQSSLFIFEKKLAQELIFLNSGQDLPVRLKNLRVLLAKLLRQHLQFSYFDALNQTCPFPYVECVRFLTRMIPDQKCDLHSRAPTAAPAAKQVAPILRNKYHSRLSLPPAVRNW